MSGENLGKATLDLEANLGHFVANVEGAGRISDDLRSKLESLAIVGNVAERALNDVKLDAGQAARSRVSAEQILAGVHGISDQARTAARELDHVRLTEAQAAESEASASLIDRALERISGHADEAKRKLLEVRLAGGRNGVGVGPFGSGFGRVGVFGTAVGVGALTGPAAAPAAVGLLAAIPTLAAGGAGAIGTLAIALDGVGKAIGGDKKAFDDLSPAAKAFVQTVRSLDDWLDQLRETAGKALFPGLTAGLKAALSPGSVAAISRALTEFGHAIGEAGAQWGRYFGSGEFQKIFGPLMRAGAQNLSVLSDAAIHLFDALGVLARAAVPFTSWISRGIDTAARLADSWLHAKDASGALAHGFDEAKTSLQLVLRLFGAILNAAGALASALYPVSKVALKDLADGLNALAGIIDRNKQTIRDIVGGALAALVAAVKAAADGIGVFVGALKAIVGEKAVAVAAITAIGVAIALSLGPTSAIITGAVIAVGLIKEHWRTILVFFTTIGEEIINAFEYVWIKLQRGALEAALHVVEPFSHLPSFLGGWARKAKDSMQAELAKLHAPDMNWSDAAAQAGVAVGSVWADSFSSTVQAQLKRDGVALVGPSGPSKTKLGPGPGMSPPEQSLTDAARAQQGGGSGTSDVFGKPPKFTKNTGATAAAASSFSLPFSLQLAQARASATASTSDDLRVDRQIRSYILSAIPRLHGEKLVGAYQALASANEQIASAVKAAAEAAKKAADNLKSFTVPLKLQVVEAKFDALGNTAGFRRTLEQIKKVAQHALKSGRLGLQGQLDAWNTIKSVNDQLANISPSANKLANESQFLQSFKEIQNSFASNAQPTAGKTDTHLYDLVQESKQQNSHLKKIVTGSMFPATVYERGVAVAG